jgi:outer membrane lipoprotein SlyB
MMPADAALKPPDDLDLDLDDEGWAGSGDVGGDGCAGSGEGRGVGRWVGWPVGSWVGAGLGKVVGLLVAGKATTDAVSTLTDGPSVLVTDDVNGADASVPARLEVRSSMDADVVVASDTTAVNATDQVYDDSRRRATSTADVTAKPLRLASSRALALATTALRFATCSSVAAAVAANEKPTATATVSELVGSVVGNVVDGLNEGETVGDGVDAQLDAPAVENLPKEHRAQLVEPPLGA